jgi:hypothetical protein
MTLYNVHLYREMRLKFERIEASTAEAAAAIARDKPTGDADDLDDCDGETFAALVDVIGDDEYRHSLIIDFEAERLRKAAPGILDALREFIAMDELADECGEWKWESLEHAFDMARAAIAKATTVPTD